jgi:Asp-tRNA(Asn)/Glu-tRNA(Gln) amidotransferase A subunit family amidase
MRRALRFASLPSGYRRRVAVDGRHYFLVVDDQGDIIAQRKAYFATAAALEAEIAALMEYVQTEYGDEGMFVIESLLLRPEQPGDPMLPICPEPDCVECAEADPYSYRIHVILPAFAGRFADMRFRRWAEEVVREEVPAHIQPKVCWVGRDDMAALEKRYRDWIYLRSGRETADRAQKLRDFVDALFASKNVYPPQSLHDCSAPEGTDKFVLGQTALGSES